MRDLSDSPKRAMVNRPTPPQFGVATLTLDYAMCKSLATQRVIDPIEEDPMAKRKDPLSHFVSNFTEDAKELVDDLLDRTSDLEKDSCKSVRKTTRRVTDSDKKRKKRNKRYDTELADLHVAIAELTATVAALAEAQNSSGNGKHA